MKKKSHHIEGQLFWFGFICILISYWLPTYPFFETGRLLAGMAIFIMVLKAVAEVETNKQKNKKHE